MPSETIKFSISIISLLVAIAIFLFAKNNKTIRCLVGAVFLLIAITFVVLGLVSIYQNSPFVGMWYGIDNDGSDLTLSITKNSSQYSLDLFDTAAWICGLDETHNPQYSVKIFSTGVVSGNVLETTSVSAICSNNPSVLGNPYMNTKYTYYKSSDTLIDNYGVIWKRK